ncbi:MAG: hypothetical protein IJ598_04505 [Ruminococcus sp.]|nr:hypothetical protein [Ruminococcus sp.]
MSTFNALRCDFCNGGLVIDDSREFAVCEFCGTKYMASTLRAKIQEFRGTVNVEGAVETTTGDTEKERLLKNAETLIRLKKFDDAEKIIKSITNQFPSDYRGWFFLYQLSLFRIKAGLNISYYNGKYIPGKMYYGCIPETDDISLESAIKLCSNANLINQFFLDLIKDYGLELHTIYFREAYDYDYDTEPVNPAFDIIDTNGVRLNALTIDTLSIWLLFSSTKTSKILKNHNFDSFRNKMGQMYFNKICVGQIVPYVFHDNYDSWILEPLTNRKIQAFSNPMLVFNFLKQFSSLIKPKSKKEGYLKEGYFIKIGGVSLEANHYGECIFYGRFIFVKDYYENRLNHCAILKLPKNIDNDDIYIANNLCKHCGGTFKGVFSKTCTKCGRVKDY